MRIIIGELQQELGIDLGSQARSTAAADSGATAAARAACPSLNDMINEIRCADPDYNEAAGRRMAFVRDIDKVRALERLLEPLGFTLDSFMRASKTGWHDLDENIRGAAIRTRAILMAEQINRRNMLRRLF